MEELLVKLESDRRLAYEAQKDEEIRLQEEMKQEQREAEDAEERRTKNRVTRVAQPPVACAAEVSQKSRTSRSNYLEQHDTNGRGGADGGHDAAPQLVGGVVDLEPSDTPFIAREVRDTLTRAELAGTVPIDHQKPKIGERLTTILAASLGGKTGVVVSTMLNLDNSKLMDLIEQPMQLLMCAEVVKKLFDRPRVELTSRQEAAAVAAPERLFVEEGVQTEWRRAGRLRRRHPVPARLVRG